MGCLLVSHGNDGIRDHILHYIVNSVANATTTSNALALVYRNGAVFNGLAKSGILSLCTIILLRSSTKSFASAVY